MTYHSSSEAIERDKARDEFMQARGYSVLRIPASVVFSTPDEAVRRIRALISEKKSNIPGIQNGNPEEKGKRASLREILSSVNNLNLEMNRSITIRGAIERETKGYADTFYAERLAIEKAIELAETEIRVDQFVSQSKKHRELYFSAHRELQEILNDEGRRNADIKATGIRATITIPSLPKVDPHPDPDIDEAIRNARQSLVAERDEFFSEVRSKLSSDEKLKELVREKLNDLSCEECWKYIS